jgi:cytochrome c oxidase cbb3-type subunit I/II
MAVNLVMTARKGVPMDIPAVNAAASVSETHPAILEMAWYSRPSAIFIIAGIAFFFLAVMIQGILPSILPQTYNPTVTSAVTGQTIQVADYTVLEQKGRQVYIREGCWYCHSQYIRPVTGEDLRWGPVSQAGEYVYDQPQLLSTRRIGPDLHRVGRKYGDDWQTAHHWNPRDVVPDSIMPRFPWLYKNASGKDTPELNEDGLALVAYLQKLGTSIDDWRETFVSTRFTAGAALQASSMEKSQGLVPRGKQVYLRRCVGCHGENGDGKGPAARFLDPKPRDFTSGIFKFRSTVGGANSLPSDEDLFITISHGLWGTAMPPWYEISVQERLAVIQFIKTFSSRWKNEKPGAAIPIPAEPPVTMESIARGQQQFDTICAACHGTLGNGVPAGGNSRKHANFTLAAGMPGGVKLGHDGRHIFKTITTGIGGTPMPSFADAFTPAQIWDIVHYVQSLRVNAHIASLNQAGLTRPEQASSFCTSSMPWLLAACNNVMLPIINFCSASAPPQAKVNIAKVPLAEARAKIWASLSEAADQQQIASQVLQIDQPEVITVTKAKLP